MKDREPKTQRLGQKAKIQKTIYHNGTKTESISVRKPKIERGQES